MNTFPHLILVLGMHRSGTSVLTRALKVFKVFIGSKHLARADNPKGFFEDADFVSLNEDLFRHLGLSWMDPKEIPQNKLLDLLNGELREKAYSFLAFKLKEHRILGLKDPRASRLLPFWRAIAKSLNSRVSCLISLRFPLSVAASLKKRDNLELEQSLALYCAYLRDTLWASANLPRLVVNYEAVLCDPKKQLQRIGTFLDLEPDQAQAETFAESFLDLNLCHHQNLDFTSSLRVYKQASMLYSLLNRASNYEAKQRLDQRLVEQVLSRN